MPKLTAYLPKLKIRNVAPVLLRVVSVTARIVTATLLFWFSALMQSANAQAQCTASACLGVSKAVVVEGRELVYTIYVKNFGSEALTDLQVTDDLATNFAFSPYSLDTAPLLISGPGTINVNTSFNGDTDTNLLASNSTLASGATAAVQLRVTVASTTAVYSNSVVASATAPGDAPVTDESVAGNDPDKNGNNDPTDDTSATEISISDTARLGLAQNVVISDQGGEFIISFELLGENLGTTDLSNISLTHDLVNTFGADNYVIVSAPQFTSHPGSIVLNAGFDGSTNTDLFASATLDAGATFSLEFSVAVPRPADPDEEGAGEFESQAVIQGTTPSGAAISDLSDDALVVDQNNNGLATESSENDPTIINLFDIPLIGSALSTTVDGDDVTLRLQIANLGNATLTSLGAELDLASAFGQAQFFISDAPRVVGGQGVMVPLNLAYDGVNVTQLLGSFAELATSDSTFIELTVTVARLDYGNYDFSLQGAVTAQSDAGGLTSDLTDSGTDPDSDGNGFAGDAGEDDPTLFSIAPVASVGIAKRYISGGESGGLPIVIFEYTLENFGNLTVDNLTITEDLNALFGAGNFSHLQDPFLVSGPPTLNLNARFNGNTNTALLDAGSYIDPDTAVTFRVSERINSVTDQGFGLGIYENQVTIQGLDPGSSSVSDDSQSGSNPDPNDDGTPDESSPTVVNVNETQSLGIALDTAVSGSTVDFVVTLENLGTTEISALDVYFPLADVLGGDNYSVQSVSLADDPGSVTLNTEWNGVNADLLDVSSSTLAAGHTASIQIEVAINRVANTQGNGLGVYSASASAQGFSSLGALLADTSDSGTDPDPNGNSNADEAGENDATAFTISADSPLGIALKSAVSDNEVTLTLVGENLGADTLSLVNTDLDLNAAFGVGNYTVTAVPAFDEDPGTLSLNPSYDGAENTALFSPGTLSGSSTFQVELTVRVDNESDQGGGFGVYALQAIGYGTQSTGVAVQDLSDAGSDPDPNGNSDPSDIGEDDATAAVIVRSPAIGIAKEVYLDGTTAIFDFYIENLGNSTVSNLFVDDPLNGVFGSGNYSIAAQPTLVDGPGTVLLSPQFFGFNIFSRIVVGGYLRPGEVSHFRTEVSINTLTDQGSGFGVYSNQVEVTATDPAGNTLNDFSDNGVNPDPNDNGNAADAGEDDATQFIVGDEARMGAALNASVQDSEVTLDIYVENFGASDLEALSASLNLDNVFGSGNYNVTSLSPQGGTGFIANPSYNGSSVTELIDSGINLPASTTYQLRAVIEIINVSDQGAGFGNYSAQFSTSGQAPQGSIAGDVSDNGTEPDSNANGFGNDSGEADPTPISVGSTQVGVAKNATVLGALVTFDYYLENLGTTAFASVSLPDDLDTVFGAGNYEITEGPIIVSEPRDLVVNSNFDGSSDTQLIQSGGLGVGGVEQVQLKVKVLNLTDVGSGMGVYSNQVTLTADTTVDISDSGTDPDPDGSGTANDAGEDEPTVFTVGQVASVGVAKKATVTGRKVTLDFNLESFANVTVSNLSLVDDLDSVFGAGNYSITSTPVLLNDPGTIMLNAGYDGSANTELLSATSTLAPGATASIRLMVDVNTLADQGSGSGIYSNQATVTGQAPDTSQYSDTSDAGTEPDADGDGEPNESGENDATVITLKGKITATVFNDANGNGSNDSELGLAGVTLFLDENTNGTLDAGEASDITNSQGQVIFEDLAAGSYTLELDAVTVPSGLSLTAGTVPQTVTLTAGQFAAANFGYQQQDASIGGSIWDDANANGTQDSGEGGLQGVTVFLDENDNGTLDSGEASTTTDAQGAWRITALAAGTYSVDVDESTLTDGFALQSMAPQSVTVTEGQAVTTVKFSVQQANASISGLIWDDSNLSQTQDFGEGGLSGVTVYVDANSNSVLDPDELTASTDGSGSWQLTGLVAGSYALRVDALTLPTGYQLTTANIPDVIILTAGSTEADRAYGYAPAAAFPDRSFTGTLPSGGSGTISFTTADLQCGFVGNPAFVAESELATPPPTGLQLYDGAVDFSVSNCLTGASIQVTIDYGSNLPAGAQLWKLSNGSWSQLAASFDDVTVTYTVADGGLGDADGVANGTIVDPAAVAISRSSGGGATPIPTLRPGHIVAIILGMVLLVLYRRRQPLMG